MPDVQDTSDYKLSKSGRKIKAHKIVFNKGEEEQMKTPQVNEVLSKDDPASKWIKDFVHSDNPKFEGKSKKKRINMALGAYYAAQRSGVKEDIDMEVVSIAEMIDRVRETLDEEQDSKHFEIYDTKTSKPLHTFKAKHMSHANIKADDWLESQGKTGKGLKVRPAKQGVAEEVELDEEQLDELKKSTLMRYASKATKSAIGLGVKAARARDEGDMATWAKNRNKAEKRDRNVQKAIGKMRSEEVEQIDELSSSTIDSYRKKMGAKIDTTRTARPAVQAAIKAKNAPIQAKIHNALMKQHQAIRRERGMSEEVEGVAEGRDLSKGPSDSEFHAGMADYHQYYVNKYRYKNPQKYRQHLQQHLDHVNKMNQASELEKKGVAEEVEQLDEIGDTPAGKRALRAVQSRAADTMSDPSKTSKQVNKAVGAGVSAGNRLHGFGHDRMKKNTVMGRDALRKQLGVNEEAEQIEEVDLVEAVQVSHDRYMRSHGKMASGKGQWLFTHKRSGDVNYRNDSEVHQANGTFSDAKKSAKMWAQKHGHSTVYVME